MMLKTIILFNNNITSLIFQYFNYYVKNYFFSQITDLVKKVEDLETIVKNQPANTDNKELVSVMRTLAKISDQLKKEKEYINNLEKENQDLKAKVDELNSTIEKRDYQIIILSNNLREQLYK